MKNSFPVLAVITSLLLVTACNNGNKGKNDQKNSTDAVTEESLPSRPELTGREERFVAYVIENNGEELALIHAAMRKGADAELRSEAVKMLADHVKMDSAMRDYAKRKNVSFDELDVASIVDIDEDQGADWDKGWASEMRTRHKRMIKKFERAQDYVQEKELRQKLDNSLPTLRSHLEQIEKVRSRVRKSPGE